MPKSQELSSNMYELLTNPNFVHGFDGKFDHPTEIYLGEYLRAPATVYRSDILTTRKAYYTLFMLFHRFDWSDTGGLIGRLDSHQFDFEGILRIVPRLTITMRTKPPSELHLATGWISVFHHQFKYALSYSNFVGVDSQGHGIRPPGQTPKGKHIRVYTPASLYSNGPSEYQVVNFSEPRRLAWMRKTVQPLFNRNGVNLPWDWNHYLIHRHCGKETDGDIWNYPVRLIKNSIKRCMISKRLWRHLI